MLYGGAPSLVETESPRGEPPSQPSIRVEGLEFLRLDEDDDEHPAIAADGSSRARLHEPHEEGCVLIVDASRTRSEQLARALGRAYRVSVAHDGAAGLDLARCDQPDLVLADVKLGGLTGLELCETIKADPGALGRTPVILLSRKDELGRRIEALDLGADDYLVKPVHVEELRTRVRNLVRVRRQERELLDALRALEERDSILTQDLMQARELQQSVLPPTPRHPALAVEATYQPADLVGGDFYDFYELPGGGLRIFLADAPGHGVRASLMTMSIKSEYEVAKRQAARPDAVLTALNERYVSTYANVGLQFTAICLDVDLAAGKIRWSTAAHPAPVLLAALGGARELGGGGTYVGVTEHATYSLHEATFAQGDAIYVYTDGITEQSNGEGEAFGEERLFAALEEARRRGRTAGSVVSQRLALFAGLTPPYDDVTLVGVHAVTRGTRSSVPPPADTPRSP